MLGGIFYVSRDWIFFVFGNKQNISLFIKADMLSNISWVGNIEDAVSALRGW